MIGQPRRAAGKSRQDPAPASGPDLPAAMEKPAFLKPSSIEVVDAVKSLYADQLKPFGRILLKRIRERRAAAVAAATGDREAVIDPDALPLIDPKCLRSVCSACKSLCVQPEDGKEYSVLLVGWPSTFVDVCSARDPYPAELWGGAASYFESLDGNEILLPGGRYACAQELVSRSLTFLQARSLGEVCHIVQLAVSQKRILGYLDGSMVPYGRSVEWVKEQCAVRQQPVCTTKRAESAIPCATWEQARACLREILDNAAGPGPGVITLSNVKRLFRSQYNLELSETVLGHSKLCDLLQDPRFQDVCSVQLQGKSQVVVQRVEPLAIGSSPFCPTAAWQFDDGVMSAEFGATSEELSAWDSAPWEAGNDYACLSTVPHDLPPWSSPPGCGEATEHAEAAAGPTPRCRCTCCSSSPLRRARARWPCQSCPSTQTRCLSRRPLRRSQAESSAAPAPARPRAPPATTTRTGRTWTPEKLRCCTSTLFPQAMRASSPRA